MATTGKVISTVSVLPAASETVTVAVAVDASAVSGAPVISPVLGLRLSPEGNPVAPYWLMPTPPEGLIAGIAMPTVRAAGAV